MSKTDLMLHLSATAASHFHWLNGVQGAGLRNACTAVWRYGALRTRTDSWRQQHLQDICSGLDVNGGTGQYRSSETHGTHASTAERAVQQYPCETGLQRSKSKLDALGYHE
jgi:hypothetical protein